MPVGLLMLMERQSFSPSTSYVILQDVQRISLQTLPYLKESASQHKLKLDLNSVQRGHYDIRSGSIS